jgi:hypothetical protein
MLARRRETKIKGAQIHQAVPGVPGRNKELVRSKKAGWKERIKLNSIIIQPLKRKYLNREEASKFNCSFSSVLK